MMNILPPPVFKYDVADMEGLEKKIFRWSDRKKLPEMELKQVLCGQNAIYMLPDALRFLGVTQEQEILVIMDEVEMVRGDQKVKPLVKDILTESGYQWKEIVLKGDKNGQVHPDFETIEQILPHLHENCAIVSVGSGVVTDLSKHSSFLWYEERKEAGQIPLIACMTADSVPAYSSRSSIISKDGVKRTWPSRLPHIIIMDYKILRDCPKEYNIAGAGDLFPLFCSFADWYLADTLGLANFLDGSWRIMDDAKDLLIPYAGEIAKGELDGIEVLSKCLTLCGLSMTFARDSVPVSGYEHVMSHMLDMSAAADGRATGLHGEQVGVSILWSLAQIEMLTDYLDQNYDSISLDGCYPEEEKMHQHIMEVFHDVDETDAMGAECWHDYQQKLHGWENARSKMEEFLKNWKEYRNTFRTLLPYTVKDCVKALSLFGHPLMPTEMKVPIEEKRMRWALRNARLMRKRFTTADLVGFLGLYDQAWEDQVVAKVMAAIEKVRN